MQDREPAGPGRRRAQGELQRGDRGRGGVGADEDPVRGAVPGAGPQDDDRAGRVGGHGSADGPEEQGRDGAAAPGSDDEHLRVLGELQQGAPGVAVAHHDVHVHRAVTRLAASAGPREHGGVLEPDLLQEPAVVGARRREEAGAGEGDQVHPVHDRQGTPLAGRLVRGPVDRLVRPGGAVDADHDRARCRLWVHGVEAVAGCGPGTRA